MEKVTIYVYKTFNGILQTPIQDANKKEERTMTRLIAADGMILKKGDIETGCIDVENDETEDWSEVKNENKIGTNEDV